MSSSAYHLPLPVAPPSRPRSRTQSLTASLTQFTRRRGSVSTIKPTLKTPQPAVPPRANTTSIPLPLRPKSSNANPNGSSRRLHINFPHLFRMSHTPPSSWQQPQRFPRTGEEDSVVVASPDLEAFAWPESETERESANVIEIARVPGKKVQMVSSNPIFTIRCTELYCDF